MSAFASPAVLSFSLVAVAATVTGCRCSQEPAPSKELAAAKPTTSASSASLVVPTPPASASGAAPVPLEKPTGTLTAYVAAAIPPLEHIGSSNVPPSYRVHRLRGALLATSSTMLYEIQGHELVESAKAPYNSRSAVLWQEVSSMYGSWPNQVWAEVSGEWVSDGARIYDVFSDTLHGENGSWDRVQGELASYGPYTIAAWSQGRVIGLAGDGFRVVTGPKTLVPKQAAGASSACSIRVNAIGLAALPSGELYAIGRGACDDNAFLVERWTDDSSESKAVDRLPAWFSETLPTSSTASLERVWLLAASPSAVYALRFAGSGPNHVRIARFDGKSWQPLPAPENGNVEASDVGADGSLWLALAGPSAFVFDPERRWQSVTLPKAPPLPEEAQAMKHEIIANLNSVAAIDARRAYFGMNWSYPGTVYEASAILSTTPEPLREPADAGAAPPLAADAGTDAGGATDAGEPTPFTPACTHPFVILFSVSASAPADFTYPATRDALLATTTRPEVKFVEFSYKDKRTLGATADKVDQAEALVRLISDRVKGSKPTLMCFAPTALIREVKLP